MPRVAPYGSWTSPISAQDVAAQGVRLGFVALDGDDVYWLEGRPQENGRNVLVRRRADGVVADVIPRVHNVRTRVHEYGGGAFVVSGSTVYYSNFSDQRIYRIHLGAWGGPGQAGGAGEASGASEAGTEGGTRSEADTVTGVAGGPGESGEWRAFDPPEAITPAGNRFYADYTVDLLRQRLIAVREDHSRRGHEAVTALVSIPIGEPPLDSSLPAETTMSPGDVIASGYDFYSTPRLSPDVSKLSWLSWRHPQMPWDGTELWVADVEDEGTLRNPVLVAGSAHESIYQPGWSPDGGLYFASDRTGWWQIYRVAAARLGDATADRFEIEPVLREPLDEAEFGRPQWLFGWATWAFADATRMAVTYVRRGRWKLAAIDTVSRTLIDVNSELEPLEWLAAHDSHAIYVAASPTSLPAVVSTSLETGQTTILRAGGTTASPPATGIVSVPEAIEFPTSGGTVSHAFYYPPRNGDFTALPTDPPPLIVISHGGPTTQTKAMLDLQVQFWTSRGFAVADVNYGGSSGYGREYRRRLNGFWGVVDVEDNIHAARYLVEQGRADAGRLIIRGGSAGGYTTLAALTFHPEVFKAGASYYGVSDVEALAKDTHKFESRYLDSLIGPYPDARETYRARSPIHFIDRLSCALICFQGLEDKVVPPDQSERMAAAVRAKGLPVAYLAFEGEQHGFRKAETIIRCLEAELYFYGAVFGFTPADRLQPVEIDNRQ